MFSRFLIVLFGLLLTIVLSEEINKDLKLKDPSYIVFPAEAPKAPSNESVLNEKVIAATNVDSAVSKSPSNDSVLNEKVTTGSTVDSEDEDKPTPRESKGIKYYSIPNQNYQSRSANPVKDNYENDDYDEGIMGDEDVDDDYDYKSLARNAPINRVVNNRNTNPLNDNLGIAIVNKNMKKSTSDNPRIISIREGFNLLRNFWRNRNEDKNKEVLPVITLTTTPTTGALTMEQDPNFDYGTPTGVATGTGTITAVSPEEIAQNNVAVQALETPSPFLSFTRKSQPVQYEIIEEYPLEGNDSNVLSYNGDYIDITSDELEPNDEIQSSKRKMPSVVIKQTSEQNQQTDNKHLQQDSLPKRKNTKLPVKVLTEPMAEIDPVEKPKVTQEVQKTGLDYYRQYLPNLQKLIEIRPKFFLNRLLPGPKKEVNDIGTQRNVQQRNFQRKSTSRRRTNQRIIKRKNSASPKIVNYGNSDQLSKTNRLPVQRVAFYVV